jgi:hypothetical protein
MLSVEQTDSQCIYPENRTHTRSEMPLESVPPLSSPGTWEAQSKFSFGVHVLATMQYLVLENGSTNHSFDWKMWPNFSEIERCPRSVMNSWQSEEVVPLPAPRGVVRLSRLAPTLEETSGRVVGRKSSTSETSLSGRLKMISRVLGLMNQKRNLRASNGVNFEPDTRSNFHGM